jgi:Protease subunit of ATP-dependent Clp proteases
MKKFWSWSEDNGQIKNESGERTLYLNGVIAEETWWGDEVTPKLFKDDLFSGTGNITVWVNSPGGDVFAAAQIYNMLMEYTGAVTVKIDGLAASAASVIAMAGGEVHMSPVSMLMIHNPATMAWGDSEEMLRAKAMLDEVKESIVNAYELKTGQSRVKLSHMMDDESWMNANKAVELGFADKILFSDETQPEDANQGFVYNRMAVTNSLLSKFPKKPKQSEPKKPTGTPIESLDKRLSLISH